MAARAGDVAEPEPRRARRAGVLRQALPELAREARPKHGDSGPVPEAHFLGSGSTRSMKTPYSSGIGPRRRRCSGEVLADPGHDGRRGRLRLPRRGVVTLRSQPLPLAPRLLRRLRRFRLLVLVPCLVRGGPARCRRRVRRVKQVRPSRNPGSSCRSSPRCNRSHSSCRRRPSPRGCAQLDAQAQGQVRERALEGQPERVDDALEGQRHVVVRVDHEHDGLQRADRDDHLPARELQARRAGLRLPRRVELDEDEVVVDVGALLRRRHSALRGGVEVAERHDTDDVADYSPSDSPRPTCCPRRNSPFPPFFERPPMSPRG